MKILVATPCGARLETDFVRSLLGMMLNISPEAIDNGLQIQVMLSEGSLTYDARNIISKKAISGGFDRVLWIDSDMVFAPDILERLNARMDEGYDFVASLAFRRKSPHKPVIYSQIGYVKDETGNDKPTMIAYEPYPQNQFFEVAASGFGCVMTSVKLLRDLWEKAGLPFSPRIGFGEDVSFCLLCQKYGYKLFCDSSIKVGHIGSKIIDEEVYNAEIFDRYPGPQR